jgi:pyruvate,water dikinase
LPRPTSGSALHPSACGPATAVPTLSPLFEALDAIDAELGVVFGDTARVGQACATAREARAEWNDPLAQERWRQLAVVVSQRAGPIADPLLDLLLEVAPALTAPWTALGPLLRSRTAAVCLAALQRATSLAESGTLAIDPAIVDDLASLLVPDSPLVDAEPLDRISTLVGRSRPDVDVRALLREIYLGAGSVPRRRLAARLLDRRGALPSLRLTAQALDKDAADFLAPYLAYSRATHLDLVDLAPSPGPPPALADLRQAQDELGDSLLREVIGQVGWARVNAGLKVRRLVGISVGGSFPLALTPAEANLLEGCEDARPVFDRFLIQAHGGLAADTPPGGASEDVVGRFRAYNLAHADMLADLLAVAPLTPDKVRTMIGRLDRIVDDFVALFSHHTDDAKNLPDVYGSLKARLLPELERAAPGQPLDADLTRLVQMFEDPTSLAAVTTLHGLKRYLHQRGLRLGFALAEAGGRTNRTIDLIVASPQRILQASPAIEFADFEDRDADDDGGLPAAVAIAAEGLAWQLLHTPQVLPKVRAFCYGNEVHYFIAFRNHPVFVRIDYSPPLRGGMIDLEYYGVSKYELDAHPNPSLDAITGLFRRLDFDITAENTRIHARYDKERAFDLADLRDKAEALFHLAPYLMDVDWVVGDLTLSPDARRAVAAAWADFFARWRVLPMTQFLTRDRQAILAGYATDAAGEREVRWQGRAAYHDRFTVPAPASLRPSLQAALESRGLAHLVSLDALSPAQRSLDRHVLEPLRAAAGRGEITTAGGDLSVGPPELFERQHDASRCAVILAGDDSTLARSAHLARLVALIERGLRFTTTGTVNGYDVQAAPLPLRDRTAAVYVLRDEGGIPRLALFAPDGHLFRHRARVEAPWHESATTEAGTLARFLRRNNFPPAWVEPPEEPASTTAEAIRALFRTPRVHPVARALPGERVAAASSASPGRAVGLARFGPDGRRPEDVEDAILIAQNVRPEDSPFLYRAAGIVSTGGGILSHAGLLASQFHKPAVVLPGRWQQTAGGVTLAYLLLDYDEREVEIGGLPVVERHRLREREEQLADGDLVVLDADEGTLRVFGQDAEALTLHEGLGQLARATERLSAATHDADVLAQRGRRLRARHLLEKVLARMKDAALARHAVRELIAGEPIAGRHEARDDLALLLERLLGNPVVGAIAREAVHALARDLAHRARASHERAAGACPCSDDPYEILSLRRIARRDRARLADALASLEASGLKSPLPLAVDASALDTLALERLAALRRRAAIWTSRAAEPEGYRQRLRHLLAALGRFDDALGTPEEERTRFDALRREVDAEDGASIGRLRDRRVILPKDGGIELQPLVGSKAANLAEAARLGEASAIPPWFAVTDCAFRVALGSRLANATEATGTPSTLSDAIERVLARADTSDDDKARLIAGAWESARLPDALASEIAEAYRGLDGTGPYVAIRSSAREEDTVEAARAGEFNTFLFVRGEQDLLAYLKRAWSGLWTARAIHNRAVLGRAGGVGSVGGGMVVQRMVDARASGVLQTVNIAEQRLREMVINVGLGLGEGIVSGAVAADYIVVSKGESLATSKLRFRYVTQDKRERVVFDARFGRGTVRVETLSHQRLRPALEYIELCELVWAASRLETAYAHPLDIEFALEGPALRLLQVRPVPAAMALWRLGE